MARKDLFHTSHWGTFTAEVEDGRFVGVRPFAKDPEPSPIIHSMVDAVYDESRVLRPMFRKGWLDRGPGGNRQARGVEPFVAVPWDEALDMVAAEIDRVRTEHGNQAIFGGSYGWSSAGRFHHAKTQVQRFLGTVGGFTTQVHTYSIAAGYAILPYVLGSAQAAMSEATTWDSIVENSELVVAFGGIPMKNTQVSSGGPGQHVAGPYLKQAREAGVEFVNVSPIRDDAGDFLDAEWLALRPNTDMALMLALAHTLDSEGLADGEFLKRYCVGFPQFARYLRGDDDGQPKDADWASPICQISPDTIRILARRMASKRTLINTNWSLQRGDHGEQPFWMTVVLAAMIGQIGLPGGGFGFGYGSMGNIGNPRRPVPSPALSAGENPCDSWIPVARISDTLLHPGEIYDFDGKQRTYPDIRLIYWSGGNPFHHHQDLNRLVEAWRRPETIIVNEPWWTATAKFSDIVLPTTTTLERNDIGATARDRFILAMEQTIDPIGEARHDYDIFRGLARRLGTEEAFTEGRDEDEWLRHIYDRTRQRAAERDVTLPSFDSFWSEGHVEVPEPDAPHVMFADYRADPHLFRLATPSGRIEIFSEAIDGFGYDDCPGHPAWLEPIEWLGGDVAARYPLHMISNQPRTRLHGQMDNGKISRDSKIQGREPVWIHPKDAKARGLKDGDVARLFNERGELLAGVLVTEEVRQGVVQLSTGAWYDPADASNTGSLDKHGNPNVLTLDKGTSRLGQGPIAHSTLIEIEKYEGDPPPVTAFTPPPTVER
ncbi:MAG: molybdopterin guanine dinucleotide-containing S/N-oxide reductase [Alphaproteobacteria bacterium]|nr:molybdopterin guanine dinucleotide-containing S/N-oxide reductase [Alphaproteobacteria bacterium]